MQTLSQLRYFRPRLYLFQLRGEAKQRVFAPVCGGELGTDRQPVMPVKRHAHGGVAAHVQRRRIADVLQRRGGFFSKNGLFFNRKPKRSVPNSRRMAFCAAGGGIISPIFGVVRGQTGVISTS